MFDALLGRKFHPKCKTNLKLISIRMEKITKRRQAVQKFFRADIADLLKNDLDINAYGRAEGLLVEINMSSCYEMVDKFCTRVSSNLSAMDRQTECPDECREAVHSLMYAAARFADLPELRELRSLFSAKYGASLESYLGKEFVERLKLRPPTKEMKLQLLQEITQEASVDWDSKALEQRLYAPAPPPREQTQREDDTSSPEMDQEAGADPSENKKPHYSGLVPPPPYYAKMKEASSASSSDSEASVESEKPKPRSVRRNRTQGNEDSPKGRISLGIVNNDGDTKDERLDDLLQHHSEKLVGYAPGKPKSNLQPPPYVTHTRGMSLPQEPRGTHSPMNIQAPTRAGSFDPDGATEHIHPNLPNYEDLASRIASLTGK